MPPSRLAFLADSTRTRLAAWTVVVFAASILCRVVYRGSYYPGWDALGPAHGLYLVSSSTLVEALRQVFYSTRHFSIWNHTNSVFYTLLPGYLGSVWPWEFWGHLFIGADDSARIRLDGRVVLESDAGDQYRLVQRSLILEPGRYPLAVEYEDVGGFAYLL